MKLTISLILIGIFQIAAGGFYGLLTPIQIEENIQTDLNRSKSAAEEKMKKELTPEFAEKWPKEFESYVWNEIKEAESLARSAREGWDHLHTTSLLLAGAGIFTFTVGLSRLFKVSLKSEPAGTGQPM
ncbi:hypothetical protein DDZ13_15045 [Coraliomargarita sinensis]|uniref:Uncharacterized protein n=1 Tax=Coraliomargarita sinensis TaxID=2174842 RepID=A0A317ZDR2_9BACT|nr:hypothetical protein [Coraliomargarita sinensis]PXA02842.1 hypothetical protein DDZ13_15045 [Coraliomargarita sinensis]